MASPDNSKPQRARVSSFLRAVRRAGAHWQAVVLLLVIARVAFLVARSDDLSASFDLIVLALFLIFLASQFFWMGRIVDLGKRLLPGKPRRAGLATIAGLTYAFIFTYSFPSIESSAHVFRAADYRLHSMLIEGAFWWWFVGSMLAFALVIAFGTVDRAVRATTWLYGETREALQRRSGALKPSAVALDPPSPARRRVVEQIALLLSATPFAAAGYGLLYGRHDVEVVRQHIRLARLPRAFEGFRIAQLSDIHIGPFTPADYIRRCVTITNALNPDLVALTGDYILWDPEAQEEAVGALAGLRAPHGVFGCLGNHEQEGGIEDSITRLFAAHGIRILRQERTAIRLNGETLNLIGMDEPRGGCRAEWREDVQRRLRQVKSLVMPGTVNILLLHYSAVFRYSSELDIDLTLSGHAHGGQLSLACVYPGLSLARLVTPYDCGWYEKDGRQLYVNRGIGTTGFPIRLGARPEITLLELTGTPNSRTIAPKFWDTIRW